jgi:hypothetical protein
VVWSVEYTDEFEAWWETLDAAVWDSIDVVVLLLEERGPNLPFPHSSKINGSRHTHTCESYEFSIRESPTASCTPLTLDEQRFCYWGGE